VTEVLKAVIKMAVRKAPIHSSLSSHSRRRSHPFSHDHQSVPELLEKSPRPVAGKRPRKDTRRVISPSKLALTLKKLQNIDITLERLLNSVYENRKKHGREWTGIKRWIFNHENMFDNMNKEVWRDILEKKGAWPLIYDILRDEISALARQECFSSFDPDTFTDNEKLKTMVDEMKLKESVPHFLDLLFHVMEPQRPLQKQKKKQKGQAQNQERDSEDHGQGDKSEVQDQTEVQDQLQNQDEKGYRPQQLREARRLRHSVFLLSSICYGSRPRASNGFPLSLGILLHQSGLTRTGLDTLAAFQVCSSYQSVNLQLKKQIESNKEEIASVGKRPTAILAYDNLDFTDGVANPRDGDESKFCSVTTAEIHEGIFIDEDGFFEENPQGLDRTWLNPKYRLRPSDIYPHSNPRALAEQENLRKNVSL